MPAPLRTQVVHRLLADIQPDDQRVGMSIDGRCFETGRLYTQRQGRRGHVDQPRTAPSPSCPHTAILNRPAV